VSARQLLGDGDREVVLGQPLARAGAADHDHVGRRARAVAAVDARLLLRQVTQPG
jgi:hypothetical protein